MSGSPTERHLLRARDLADRHYDEPIGVAAMAAAAGLSQAYFTRAFTETFGVTPHGYLLTKDGTLTTFDAPGNVGTEANAVNGDGDVAGVAFDSRNTAHGFVRAANGSLTQFDAPDAGTGCVPR